MAGSGTSLVGGLIVVGSIFAAPFTGGASVAAGLATGTAIGVSGAATNIIGGSIVNGKIRDAGNEARKALLYDNDRQTKLFDEFEELEKYCARRVDYLNGLDARMDRFSLIFMARMVAFSGLAVKYGLQSI